MNKYEAQVRKFYSEIWNNKRLDEIPDLLHNDVEFRGSLGQEKIGHEGFREYVEYVHGALGQYKCTIEDIVVQSEKVFTKMLFTGHHRSKFMGYEPTNKKVFWEGAALFEFSGYKVSRLWVLGDLKGLEKLLASKT